MSHPLVHDSYLINLASPSDSLWQKSVDAMVQELHRAETLGIRHVVAHPSAPLPAALRRAGWTASSKPLMKSTSRRGRSASAVCWKPPPGKGPLGWRFEHLAAILGRVQNPDRLGVCFDTCHVFAAGYPLATLRDYRATMREFDQIVGARQIRAFHLNDSLRELGSRVDRHAHIGLGTHRAGKLPPALIQDSRFRQVPMYLETPKGLKDGRPWDEINWRCCVDSTGNEAIHNALDGC